MSSKRTMSDLINEKKRLLKRIRFNPELEKSLYPEVEEIERKLEARVNKNDTNFLRIFYRNAKNGLPVEVFNRLEDVSATRHNDQVSK